MKKLMEDWRIIVVAAILAGGGGFGGGALFADDEAKRMDQEHVERIVERHPTIVTMGKDLENLDAKVTNLRRENKEAHQRILDAIKELKKQ